MPRGEHSKDDEGAKFIPTEAEIAAGMEEIRERGYRDRNGKWHGPKIEGADEERSDAS